MFAENLVDSFEQEVLGAILGESEYKHTLFNLRKC